MKNRIAIIYLVTILCSASYCKSQTRVPERKETKVTLGIKPDYFYTFSGIGVKAKEVIVGKPAQLAGMKDGDIIFALDTVIIKNIFSYQDVLAKYNHHDKVIVTIIRDKKKYALNAVFQ